MICDGAAQNLSALKATHGHSGKYGYGIGSDAYVVKPWFVNPFKPPHYIYWLICPSHQVLNVILMNILSYMFEYYFVAQEYD